jgi:hypothetical protein
LCLKSIGGFPSQNIIQEFLGILMGSELIKDNK